MRNSLSALQNSSTLTEFDLSQSHLRKTSCTRCPFERHWSWIRCWMLCGARCEEPTRCEEIRGGDKRSSV